MEGRLESFVDEIHEDTAELPSYLNEEESSDDELFVNQPNKKQLDKKRKRGMKGNNVGGFEAATWLPSEMGSVTSLREVIEERDRQKKELHTVYDGASAPKLSGFNRSIS